jgi:hypothetical protein
MNQEKRAGAMDIAARPFCLSLFFFYQFLLV